MRVDHVDRSFGRATAAADVTFDVHRGEVFALVGHNGAGKTTLIRLINGLLTPDGGQIETFGLDPTRHGDLVRRRTGVLTTYPGLDEYLSARENLAVYAAINGVARGVTQSRTAALLTRLGLDPLSAEPTRGLSAGLKQRVALARALIHDPELLLLDEPTANLDPIAARDVRRMVRELADEGRTVLFCSHNLAEAESLADRVGILREGQLVAAGSVDELALGRLQAGVDLHVGRGQGSRALEVIRARINGHVPLVHAEHIRVDSLGPASVPELVRALVTAGVDVLAAVPTTPTLEDVYLAVHEPAAGR